MFGTYFDEVDDRPPDIAWFERLWLLTLALSVIITIMMFDSSVDRFGRYGAALLTCGRFGGTYLLMLLCTRRKSNFWRWVIAIPFSLAIVAYNGIQYPEMAAESPVLLFVAVRLVLIAAAIYMLFTPRSRAWFAGRPPPEDLPPPEDI